MTSDEENLNREKIERSRQIREAETEARRAEARDRASNLWASATHCTTHEYLTKKGISAHGARLLSDKLVLPLRDINRVLHSLQFIDPKGGKQYLAGGRVRGCYFGIGEPKDTICIVEGFATGASIHEATGFAVAVAFNAGNLKSVAKSLRVKFPTSRVVVCGDDDYRTEGNPGKSKASEAALAVGGWLAFPNFGQERPEGATDFNDLAQSSGQEAIKRAVLAATRPPKPRDSLGPKYSAPSDLEPSVNLVRASEITPEPVSWLWQDWLAAGKLHVLAGSPGTGKTTISLALAAPITTGDRWPDGTTAEPGNVVIWSGEDDPADTLIPRLALMGANLDRVFFVSDVREGDERRSFDPAKDMEPLRRKLREIGEVQLLIVDPIVSAIAGDSHKNAEVRRSLQPLVDLAASLGCALVGITHFSKTTTGKDPLERVTGSLAFGAVARLVWVAAKHQEESEDGREVRFFLRAKSNLGPDGGGFEYKLQQGELKDHKGVFASSLLWGNPVKGNAREILAVADSFADESQGGTLREVKSWLAELMAEEGGKIDRRDAMRAGNAMGYKERTIHRARESLGYVISQSGFGRDKRSVWVRGENSSPAIVANACQPKGLAGLASSGTHGDLANDSGDREVF
jgi:putative DNA primase/helicase